jgi:hypothetical protein
MLAKCPDDEPVWLLRGQDATAPAAVLCRALLGKPLLGCKKHTMIFTIKIGMCCKQMRGWKPNSPSCGRRWSRSQKSWNHAYPVNAHKR